VLTAAQRTKFVTFVTGVWPGAAADIKKATLRRDEAGQLLFQVSGTITTSTVGELPDPPFTVDVDGSDYIYDYTEEVVLNAAQTTAFVDFVQDTWTGVAGDVEDVTWRRGDTASDITAQFRGTKTVATVGDLPDRKVRIRAIT
jgi:hypothetical protein